jgi:hypothetical protein
MDDRNIRLAVSKFDEYAMAWWDNAIAYVVTTTWYLSLLGMI